jgi:hypothetical protein
LNNIFLRPELREEHPTGWRRRVGLQGRVQSIRFLDQYNERQVGVRALPGEFPVPDTRDYLAQPTSPNPDIPAQHYEARVVGSVARAGKVQRNRRAHIPAPTLQSEALVILVANQSEFSWDSQPLPRHPEPVIDVANAAHRGDKVQVGVVGRQLPDFLMDLVMPLIPRLL